MPPNSLSRSDWPERRFFLWGVPRSVSSTVERAFQQRNDTEVISEPLIDGYYCSDERCSDRFLPDDPGNTRYSYRALYARMLAPTQKPFMMSKNMAYYVNRRDPTELLAAGENSFIIREPERALRSHYRIDQNFTAEEAGYNALRRMFDRVTNDMGQPPIVIDGNDLRSDPEGTLRMYCEALHIPFDTAMLRWKAEEAFDPRYKMWTDDIDRSTGFVPEQNQHAEIELPSRVMKIIEESRPHYEYLAKFALRPNTKPTSPPASSPGISSAPQ